MILYYRRLCYQNVSFLFSYYFCTGFYNSHFVNTHTDLSLNAHIISITYLLQYHYFITFLKIKDLINATS